MSDSNFPDQLLRVSISAEDGVAMKVAIKTIACKRHTKVFKTASGKSIKLSDLMQPTSVVDPRFVMEHTYCLSEDDVQQAIQMLVQRAREKAEANLAHAQAVRNAAYGNLNVSYD